MKTATLLKTITLACLLSLLFTGPAYSAAKVVKVVYMQNTDDQMDVVAKRAKEYIERETGGRYKLELFCCGKMGSEEAMFTSVKMGVTQIGMFSSPGYAHPVMNLVAVPYAFKDRDHFYRVFEGPVGAEINQVFTKATGVEPVAHFYRIHQYIFTSKPLINPQDWRQFKIRTATAPCWTAQVEGIGGSVVPLPFSEVYMALQTGVIDGVQTVLDWFVSFKLHEVCKYAIDIKHDLSPMTVFINEKWLQRLPAEDQRIFRAAFVNQKAENEKWVDEAFGRYQQAMFDNGVTLHTASDEDVALYRSQLHDFVRERAGLFGGSAILEKLLAVE